MSYGAQIKYGIARQATAGAPVTTAGSFHPFPLLNEDVGLEKDEVISQNLTGRFAQGAVYDGVARVTGTIEFELTPRSLAAALVAAIDWATPAVGSGSLRAYSFLPNTNDYGSGMVKAPLSIYKQFSDVSTAELFSDCQIGQLELTIAQGQFARGRLTVSGGARVAGGVGSLNVVPDAADIDDLFPWNVASVSLGGAAMSNLSEVTVAINENIEPLYALDATLKPYRYTRSGFREVTVNGTFYYNDRTILNNFVADTQSQLLIYIVNTKTAIQSGYYNSLLIDVPRMKITQFKPGASGPGEVSVSFTARGVVDPTSNYDVRFVAQNTYVPGF